MTSDITTLTATDSTPVVVHRWRPAGEPRGVVVVAHGMAEHGARYSRLAAALTEAGWVVYAPDHRGHGLTAGMASERGFLAHDEGWARVVEDLASVVTQVREDHPGLPVVLLGHSMGSLLARTYVLDRDDVDALVLSGTAGDPGVLGQVGLRVARAQKALRGERHRSTLMDRLTFGAYNKAFEPTRTRFDWLSRDADEVDAYIADEACGEVFTTSFFVDLLTAMRPINDPATVARMPHDLPVYVVSGEADPVGANGDGVRQVADRMRSAGVADVTVRLYPHARHEIFNETNRDEVTADLLTWLDATLPAARG